MVKQIMDMKELLGFKITGKSKSKILTANERFDIEKELGSGGFGVVYQTYDKERQTLVALKTLNNIDADALYPFKKEFRMLWFSPLFVGNRKRQCNNMLKIFVNLI